MKNKDELLKFITLRYKKVAIIIEAYWDEPDFDIAVNRLLMDSRDGHRQGFPMDITNAIFELVKLHDTGIGKADGEDRGWAVYPDGDR